MAERSLERGAEIERLALSVVMPVHNALPHLDAAIESILRQSFRQFEFVILDDGSTDGSSDRISHWAGLDSRIRVLHSDSNLGPVESSNAVARAARTPFVARMDADDISHPDRLRDEFELLRSSPETGIVASLCEIVDASGRLIRGPEPWRLARPTVFVPFAHGAMMYRREIFDRVGGYRRDCEFWEDQDLVVRMARFGAVVVIPRSLYRIRIWRSSTRLASNTDELELALDRMYRATDRLRTRGEHQLGQNSSTSGKIDPRVFIAFGSVRLWAGEKPRLFTRLLRRGNLALNARTVSALVWTAWASASPSSLRAFLTLLLKMRNKLSSATTEDVPVHWDPFGRRGG